MGLPVIRENWTLDEFLAWEEAQPEKYEFVKGEVYAMVGARQQHVLAAGALFAALRQHLRGTPCRTYMADMRLRVEATAESFYPDVMVSCDPADRVAELQLQSPCLVAEVLSDSTAAFDRGDKFAAYRQIPSLQEYLLVDLARRRLELFRRQPEGWTLYEPQGEPAMLELASVKLVLPVASVFEDLDP